MVDATSTTANKPQRKPRGWQGYDGKRKTAVDDMGPAADASVRDQSGKEVKLASLWRDGDALIVFYRGHW